MVDPAGFSTLTANLGIKDDTTDLLLVSCDLPTSTAGVFTRSRFAGPSVELSRSVAMSGQSRGLVVVSKNANVANGEQGRSDAAELQALTATHLGAPAGAIAVASTGVIGRPYPMDRVRSGFAELGVPTTADFEAAAQAIMTTDTKPKLVRAAVGDGSIVGIAKGVGMIEPDMATLLTFFFTDVGTTDLDAVLRSVCESTFNALSIDTDTSTSDTAMVFANTSAGVAPSDEFASALHQVALGLVRMIAADGEGATKVIEATVTGARDAAQARRVAKSIVNSPLVKTAVHGSDPNWGRIAMAVGKCHDCDDVDAERVRIRIGETAMYPPAAGLTALATAAAYMRGATTIMAVDLGVAGGTFTAYGCDLTDGYVRINADYTT